jgi:hypothetical protein
MKKAETLGKQIKYNLGYSNFSFELWLILHKMDCNEHFTHKGNYIDFINKAYGENFESSSQYKHERSFRRVLQKLCLDDVKRAIQRARDIMHSNKKNGYISQHHKKYTYYRENPSLSVWEMIDRILRECGLSK